MRCDVSWSLAKVREQRKFFSVCNCSFFLFFLLVRKCFPVLIKLLLLQHPQHLTQALQDCSSFLFFAQLKPGCKLNPRLLALKWHWLVQSLCGNLLTWSLSDRAALQSCCMWVSLQLTLQPLEHTVYAILRKILMSPDLGRSLPVCLLFGASGNTITFTAGEKNKTKTFPLLLSRKTC